MAIAAENLALEYNQLTDEQLVERYKTGDRRSLDFLITAHISELYRRIHGQVPESDVEDVRQEILLSFVKSIGNFTVGSSFAAWLATIAKRRIVDYYRQTARQVVRLPEDEQSEMDDAWENIDDELTVKEALVAMPEKYRAVLSLRLLEDRSFGDISKALDLNYEAVRSRYRRGITMLKEKLEGNL